MNLAHAFVASAQENASKPAIFWGECEVAYQSLHDEALRLAGIFQARHGVKPGDRVGLWLRNCPEFVTALFGVLMAGGVVVPINNFLKPDEVGYILNDAEIDLLIGESETLGDGSRLKEFRPSLKIWTVEDVPWGGRPLEGGAPLETLGSAGRVAQDLAVIIYTSGTTGHPKGAMLSHENLLSNLESCRVVLQALSADRFVVLLPMFHSFMLCVGVLLPLMVGGAVVIIKSLHPPKNILAEIMHRQATILPAIPQFFRTLAQAPLPEGFPLRACVSGGAPLPVEILREFNQRMPIPLIEGYGLSEASPVVSLNPLSGPWKEGSIGRPIPGVEVTIQNEAGEMLALGAHGELCVRGRNVMLGYWNQEEETAKTLRDGWLRTGDIGYQDEDGYFFITDRKKDMLLVNGINVYPREIEEVIYQFEGIREAAVVGFPDRRRGEQAVAFVAMQEGVSLSEPDLLKFVRSKLADYKVPRAVRVLDALPRNATGKILKTELRKSAL